MMPAIASCPHCGQERPPHLVPRNYLCLECQERATDVLGWDIRLFNDMGAPGGAIRPTGNGAKHDDDSRCREVEERSAAYVDGLAYQVVGGRFGGVFLTPPASTAPPASEMEPGQDCMNRLWQRRTDSLSEDAQWLKDGDFLTVDYFSGDPDYAVYGQLAPEEDGVHCEVVSNKFMPADDWPLDAGYLQLAGWAPPYEDTPNWFRVVVGAELAAEHLLLALRHGRGCDDARRLNWHPATFPGHTDD